MNPFLLLVYFLLATVISSQTKPGFETKAIVCVCLILIAAIVYIDAAIA